MTDGICKHAGCENYVEGRTEYCATHNHGLRRLAKDLNKVPKKQKPLKKVSDGKKLVNGEYSKLRKEYLQIWSACEVGPIIKEIGYTVCTRNATQIHHCSTNAANFLNDDTWLSTCANCHEAVETKIPAEKRRELQLLYD